MSYDDVLPESVTADSQCAASPTPTPLAAATSPVAGKTSAPNASPQGVAKVGAPTGNRNAERHGCWGFLALGRLPKGGAYIRRLLGELRRELEARVSQAHGEISLGHAALVTTVCRHEGRALLLSRYLAMEGDSIKLMDRVSVLESIGRATDARDRTIEKLDLGRHRGDDNPFAEFDRQRERDQQAAIEAAMRGGKPALPSVASVLPAPSDEYARPHTGAVPADDAAACEFGGQER